MSYSLTKQQNDTSRSHKIREALTTLSQFLDGEKRKLVIVFIAVVVNSASNIATPYLVAIAIDQYIKVGNLAGLSTIIWTLLILYILAVGAGYLQARVMGHISQRTLFRLRNTLFGKIQSLPIAFFNQNTSGDLISRLNNDTDKLNQFLSESLLRFVAVFFSLVGIGIFIFFIDVRMALITLSASILVIISTQLLSNWVKQANKKSLEITGALSADVQENLSNFKALVAFNRQDYFEKTFADINERNFNQAVRAQIANNIFSPIYNFAGNIAQIIVLGAGLYFISQGQLTIGILIGFITYTQKFYEPLRILGAIWGNFQSAIAAWVRVQEILGLKSNLEVLKK